MANILTPNVRDLVKQLIFHISGFDDSSEYYDTIEDFAFNHIASPDYYFTYDKNAILTTIKNLGEKFRFHGFTEQSNAIISLTDKLFDTSKSKDVEDLRVSIIKFLLNISHSPTTKFAENPNFYKPKEIKSEHVIDREEFIKDTKLYTIQSFSESSDESWSELSDSSTDSHFLENQRTYIDTIDTIFECSAPTAESSKLSIPDEKKIAKDELIKTIQTSWWNEENITIAPSSTSEESRVAIEWERYVYEATYGLVTQQTNIVPEYKIMRELIWQFFGTTSCFSFGFEKGIFHPKSGISIASVRPHIFQYFLLEFVTYFEMMKSFKNFQSSLNGEYFVASIPDSYRSYSEAIQEIIEPVYIKIREIEYRIQKQDQPITILIIAQELRPFFRNLECLYNVHSEIMKVFTDDNSFKNSTFLLTRLYYGLLNSSDTNEQKIFLTLYLKSLYKYFTIIEIWLSQDILDDSTDEFIIFDKNSNMHQDQYDWKVKYVARILDPICKMDGMLSIICTKVLQLAKNIHLLRLLGKLHLISSEFGSFKDSLYEEYVNKVLHEAENYIQENKIDKQENEETSQESEEKFSVICPEQDSSKSGMDSIENFLDFSDGFLATVFHDYVYQQNTDQTSKSAEKSKSLFETISERITKIFPVKQILEKTFFEVLNSRYSVPGLMVKDMLINQYHLKKQFLLFKHLYLFEDDIIFPFYKNMFKQFDCEQAWGNFYWLTSQLQDLLMDLYPDFYEYCRVDVEPNWRLCTNPITACEMVSVHYRINWPVNIIITPENIVKYHDVFRFILKLKWAMNTLNRLRFTDIEPKNKPFKLQSLLIKQRIRKLQSMRFFLVNDVSSIQHYILGHLFSGLWKKFEKSIEDSYDLESIIAAHDKYINRIYRFCMKLRDEMSDLYGFRKILSLVHELREMWKNIHNIDDEVLHACEMEYRKCHRFLRPIIELEVSTF